MYFGIQSINAYINQKNNREQKLVIDEKDYKGHLGQIHIIKAKSLYKMLTNMFTIMLEFLSGNNF